ncbi:MAG TPA: site-specific recombinase [Methyloradius sp.]|nr:site-specific recombinase [Methyloradius sp.]
MLEHAFEKYLNSQSSTSELSPETISPIDQKPGQKIGEITSQAAPQLIADLVAFMRPKKPSQVQRAVDSIEALSAALLLQPEKARLLREAILTLLSEHKPISLFLVARHSVFTGFFTEMHRRLVHKILPEAIDPNYLIDLFALFFTKTSDEKWVLAVPDEVWKTLIDAIAFEHAPLELVEPCLQNLLEAVQVLSYRISALGLEPELLRNHPELEQHTSPFITQNEELTRFLANPNFNHGFDNENADADIKHILVMLDQCQTVVDKIRRNSAQTGTSIRLTNLIQRVSQQIERLETLLRILTRNSDAANSDTSSEAKLEIVRLFKELVYSECHKNDISEHWQENMEVMALRVTENASRTGEHYITENRSEYFALMRSAMGAGVIIGFMAMLKIIIANMHLAALTEAILFSLNYGLGFVLIHILHFTVATKQPAMTAAAIAASIDAADSKSKEMDNLIAIIANTTRSQLVAIFGNVVIVIPVAMLIGFGLYVFTGEHFVSAEKAESLLTSIDPLRSGMLFYAAIAGVCLFLSGLIAGYHDNIAIYNKIPQRLRALTWLQKLLGPSRLERVANYVENNLGALAGNFYFGCLLGGMSGIGVLLGLPIDIRHITFSSAFVGFSAVGLDFFLDWRTVLYIAFGLALIGFINLTVSFGLALFVAMKSRKARFKQWRVFIRNLATRLNEHPSEFIMPPKKTVESVIEPDIESADAAFKGIELSQNNSKK